MKISVHADASFSHTTRVAAWAVCVESEHEVIWRSEVCEKDIDNSNYAELRALIEGVRIAVEEMGCRRVKEITLHSDCRRALGWALGTTDTGISQQCPVLAGLQRRLVGLLAGRIRVKTVWVRGHQPGTTNEDTGVINRVLDAMANRTRKVHEPEKLQVGWDRGAVKRMYG